MLFAFELAKDISMLGILIGLEVFSPCNSMGFSIICFSLYSTSFQTLILYQKPLQASAATTDASCESAATTPRHALKDANNPAGYLFKSDPALLCYCHVIS